MAEAPVFRVAPDTQVGQRKREIGILINVAEPDPAFQPLILTDEASLLDAVGGSEEEIRARLSSYFRCPFPLPLGLPLPRLVDELRIRFPGWPDDW